ncbi:hypothetical protein ACFQ67_32745 [Streptomyces sp. NPDC056488]|uniref:hypothetical protein n=1 Tax=unclassified Streptomyces TaxID=2593676 RepID=UPI00367C77E3
MAVDQASWDASVRHLYRDATVYIATGPRRHEDWVLDVLAVTARVPDPRGWAVVDDTARHPDREGFPTYPFAVHPPEYVARRLQEIDRDSAEDLLLALTETGCTLDNLRYFDETPDELRAMARTVLARYGDEATFHTNVSKQGSAPGNLDFTREGLGYKPLGIFMEDCGLVVVTDTEVGLFWSFADQWSIRWPPPTAPPGTPPSNGSSTRCTPSRGSGPGGTTTGPWTSWPSWSGPSPTPGAG